MKEKHLGLKDAIHEANKSMSGAYFPFSGIIPLIATMDNGSEIEVATSSNEGMAGVRLLKCRARACTSHNWVTEKQRATRPRRA